MDEEQEAKNSPEGEEDKETNNLPKGSGKEEKLSTPAWVLLLVGAAILDLFQAGIAIGTLGTFGTLINVLIDINVGLSLALFFFYKNMLDWKVGLSVIFGFAADFITIGIAPSWLLDILYVWMVTDGAKMMNLAPVIGEAAQKAALTIMSKGKNPAQQSQFASRSANIASKNRSYMAQKWGMGGKDNPSQQTPNNRKPLEQNAKTNNQNLNTVNAERNQTTPNREKTSLRNEGDAKLNEQNTSPQNQPETENGGTPENNPDSNSANRETKEPENTGKENRYSESGTENQATDRRGPSEIEARIKIFGNLRVKEAKARFVNGATQTIRPGNSARDVEFSYSTPTESQKTGTKTENPEQETNSTTKQG
jgi:hypothetical protein